LYKVASDRIHQVMMEIEDKEIPVGIIVFHLFDF
jgi:hypothetical protein